jgi:hypothetical protein
VGSDASLRFNDLSPEIGYGFLRLAARACGLANRKPSGFQGLDGITVLLELDPNRDWIEPGASLAISAMPRKRQ